MQRQVLEVVYLLRIISDHGLAQLSLDALEK